MIRRLSSRGDTIVEVLIAILVVSVILSGAFVSARKSQSGIRQTEERVEALKVTEAQVERLKAIAASSASDIPTSDATFCINDSNNIVDISAGILPLASDVLGAGSAYHPSECNITPAAGIVYYSAIEYTSGTSTFIVHTRWDGAGGSGLQEVLLAIRIDP